MYIHIATVEMRYIANLINKQVDVLPSKNEALCASYTTVNLLLFNVS